ncbi:MAG: hypothetical protein RMJ19_01725, partial [Gemmatales bacterium]|nr:hypothetical protein [Gemmatales bacterium]MDW8174365.1 hypothetical protein [Gemmatales bacterium]
MNSEETVQRFAARLKWTCAIRGAVWGMVGAMLIWGSAVLILRLATSWAGESLLSGGVLLVSAAALFGAGRALRRVPSREQLLAVLDAANQCGGLLMSRQEVALRGWAESVAVQRVPTVSWKKRKALMLLVISSLYVAVVLLLPQRYLRPVEAGSMAVAREVDRLQQQLERMKESGLLDQARYEELQAELQQIQKNATVLEPGRSQEALDHVEQVLKELAMTAMEERLQERELLQLAKAFTQTLQELLQSGQIKPEQAKQGSQALEKFLQQAGANSQSDKKVQELKKWLEAHGNDGLFDEKELKELAELLDELLEGENLDLEGLADLGVIDPEWLKRRNQLQIDPKTLKWLRAELVQLGEEDEFGLDPGELALLLARIHGRQGKDANMTRLPGQGGVTRGRADAELTFGKPSSAEGVQFQPEALKPGPLHNLNT